MNSRNEDAAKMLTLNDYFDSKNDPFITKGSFYRTTSPTNVDATRLQRKTTTPAAMYRNFIKNANMHDNLIHQDNGCWTQRTVKQADPTDEQSDKRAKTSQANSRKNLKPQSRLESALKNNNRIMSKLHSNAVSPLGFVNKNAVNRMASTPRVMTSRSNNRRNICRNDDRARNKDFFQTLRSECY